jgi:hypothetical protein
MTPTVTGWVRLLASGEGAMIVWGSLAVAALLIAARWALIPEQYRLTDVLAEVG